MPSEDDMIFVPASHRYKPFLHRPDDRIPPLLLNQYR